MDEQELRRQALEAEARQTIKMEAIGRVARVIAHDFNNVLAAIIGSADLLMLKLRAANAMHEEAEEIRKAADRGTALTRQLLAFSGQQVFEPEVVDLPAAIRHLEGALQRLAGERAQLRVSASQTPVRIQMEPRQLEEMLTHLVRNASEAMPDGGTIDVSAGSVRIDERMALKYPSLPAGDYAHITIRDAGRGINPEVQAHVFEPYYTTKVPSKGFGLGLAIVYGIVKENGGAVTFSTAPNAGTTFEVVLPRAA